MRPHFIKKIRYITTPFYNAWLRGAGRLADILDREPLEDSGTFFTKAGKEWNTIFYRLKTEGTGKEWNIRGIVMIFANDRDHDKPALAILTQRTVDGVHWFCSHKGVEAGCTDISVISDILTLVLFLKYCELDTKIVKPGKTERHTDNKYENETGHKIEILDSTWFTTIIRSEGFMVGDDTGGFFRLQPCGPGLSQRKLIWVLPFEKKGYTRTAKVLNQ